MDQELKTLEEDIQKSETVCQRYEKHLQEMEDFQRNAAEERDRSREEINEAFQELVDVLMAQKKKLFNWMDEEWTKRSKLHPKDKVFVSVSDGLSQLSQWKRDYVVMDESLAMATSEYENSSRKRKREEDTNDFHVSLSARRLKTTDAFGDLKGVLQDISSFAEDYSCTPRFDDRGFKFVESIFPRPTGVVKFDAIAVSRIGGQRQSPSVRIGGFSWRIGVEKRLNKTFEQDESACWFVRCQPVNDDDSYWRCDASLDWVIKSQSGGKDFTSSHTVQFKESTRGGVGSFFKDTFWTEV